MLATSLNSKTVPSADVSSDSACGTERATFSNTQEEVSKGVSLADAAKVDDINQTEEEN